MGLSPATACHPPAIAPTNDPASQQTPTIPIPPQYSTKLAGANNEYLVKLIWKNTCTIP